MRPILTALENGGGRVMPGQLALDLDYDERVARLAREVAIVVAPHLAPGTKTEAAKLLAERVAMLAWQRLKYEWEPPDAIRCHTCDELTYPKNRVRVAVCPRCSAEGRAAGSRG
jgi:hypothetical protein